MTSTSTTKRYPFSLAKHAHDIELAHNYEYCHENWARVEELNDLLLKMRSNADRSGRVTWLEGRDYARAKELTGWAAGFRDECMNRK